MELLTRKSFKYRIYPTKSQENTLENQFSMCRHLYNWNLAERIAAYQEDGTTISYNQQQNKLPPLKEERPWFKSVHSQVLQDVLRRLDNGYQAFFRRVKNGETPGFPKFKKRGQWDSISFPQYHKRPTDSFIYTSDGSQEPIPKYLRKKEKQLQRLQRRLSKTLKGTKKYLKLLKALQKCYYRIKCQRNNFLHKKANQLLDASDTIFHEKLNVRNMIRRPKPKMDEETTRTHRCECGFVANRDHNAALNILRIGMDTLQASTLIEAPSESLIQWGSIHSGEIINNGYDQRY